MLKKLAQALLITFLILILPVFGNVQILYAPHLWILLIIGVLASILQPGYNPFNKSINPEDKGTVLLIIWSVYLTQLAAVIEAAYLRFPNSVKWDMISTVALIIMLSGLALRTWAVYTLGNFFTMQLAAHKEQALIRSGPYKYVRHPSYTGAFLIYAGTAVFLHSWFSLIAALIILPAAWLSRIYYEEKLLFDKFGEEYINYCRSVKKLIPWIW